MDESLNTLGRSIARKIIDALHEHPKEVNTILGNMGVLSHFGGRSGDITDMRAIIRGAQAMGNNLLKEDNLIPALKWLKKGLAGSNKYNR